MFTLFVLLLVVGVAVGVLLLVGCQYLQSYWYTEPADLRWRAPVAALALTAFWGLWCLIDAVSADAAPGNLPLDVIHRFSNESEVNKEPAEVLWAVKDNSKDPPVEYHRVATGQDRYEYRVPELSALKRQIPNDKLIYRPRAGSEFRADGVDEIVLGNRDTKDLKDGDAFRRPQRNDKTQEAKLDNLTFYNAQGHYVFPDRNPGQAYVTRFSLFLANIFLNGLHLVLWFVLLWLVLHFDLTRAILLAVALWVMMTFLVLPMMLNQAGVAAQKAAQATPQAS